MFDYTTEMYEEDLKISLTVYFKKFKLLYHLKDDLIQVSLIALYKARQKFDNNKTSSYFSFAFCVSKNAMLYFLKDERKQRGIEGFSKTMSLDFVFPDGYTLADILSDDIDLFDIFHNSDFKVLCDNIIKSFKSDRRKRVCNLFLKGKTFEEIGKELNISKQACNRHFLIFRDLIKEDLVNYYNL